MTTHNMTLKPKYFTLIKNGQKTIELRLYDTKRRQIEPGDQIHFRSTVRGVPDNITVKVLEMITAGTFMELFRKVDPKDCGFENSNEAVSIMEEFYPENMQRKVGVVGIRLQLIKEGE